MTTFYSSHSKRLFSNLLSDWLFFLKLLRVFTLQKSLTLDVTSSKVWVSTFIFGKSSLILPPLEKYWHYTIYILICSYIYLCIKISSDQWLIFLIIAQYEFEATIRNFLVQVVDWHILYVSCAAFCRITTVMKNTAVMEFYHLWKNVFSRITT